MAVHRIIDQNGDNTDLVVMDDFLFSEPTAVVPEPVTWVMLSLGLIAVGSITRLRRRGGSSTLPS